MRRWMPVLFLLLATLVAVPAHASAEAERYRLQQELQKLASRNAWNGVERTYADLVKLQLPLAPIDHLLASQAAQNRGETIAAMDRLALAVDACDEASAAADPSWQEAKRGLDALRSRYGKVDISVVPPRLPALIRYDPPFAVQEREAIARAREQLSQSRAYVGLLPVGKYMVDGLAFEVETGAELLRIRVVPPQ